MLPASLHASPWGSGATLADRFEFPDYCLRQLDEIPFGIWVCDLSGGVCYVSPAFLEAVGMGLEQCRAEGWIGAVTPEEADATLEKWRACLREGSPWCHEFRLGSGGGKLRHVLGRGNLARDQNGKPVAWVGVNLDLTELRRAEDAARRQEERKRLSQRLEVIGRLAGGVAHDFNNLLTAINGYSELLIAMLGNNHDTIGYAREILRAGEKAAQLTRQLLAFSRRQVLAPKALDLNSVIRGSEAVLRNVVGPSVEVIIEARATRAGIQADPAQMDQILLNLACNARDAMPLGGRLRILTCDAESPGAETADEWAGYGPSAPAGYVVMAVRDTGSGMDDEVKAHLFEPFYSTKDRSQGLGLPAVYGIVNQNAGHIKITSRRGEGTEVRIYWPLKEEKRAAPLSAMPFAGRSIPMVLVAEDDEEVRKLVRRILTEKGFSVLTASSGQEALDVCRRVETPIDLLLADVVMPGMGGVELAGAAQPLRPTMKVLFMSAYLNLKTVRGEVLASNQPFLGKPFSPVDLLSKINDILELRAVA